MSAHDETSFKSFERRLTAARWQNGGKKNSSRTESSSFANAAKSPRAAATIAGA
jgi:hypothetical protein